MASGSSLSRRDLLKGVGLGALSMAAAGPAFALAGGDVSGMDGSTRRCS